ncbi:DUF2510 domain-containing protein [Mycolicibacterium iranicum]|uniref:DUF2510 domain-containing protein n=1 Tax=Mycolicibacterium iranicum TaxID=912594 RepID=UPI000466DEDC
MTGAGPEPGWYIDPDNEDRQRYWNGSDWTEHRTAGLPDPSPVPVRIVKKKRASLPKPVFVGLVVAAVAAAVWGFVAMQQSAQQDIDDFKSSQMRSCMSREGMFNDNYSSHIKTCTKEVYGRDIG